MEYFICFYEIICNSAKNWYFLLEWLTVLSLVAFRSNVGDVNTTEKLTESRNSTIFFVNRKMLGTLDR